MDVLVTYAATLVIHNLDFKRKVGSNHIMVKYVIEIIFTEFDLDSRRAKTVG